VPTAYEPPAADTFAPPAFSAPVDPLAGFLHPNDVPAPMLSEPLPVAAAPTSESVMSTRLPAALRPIAYGAEDEDEADDAIASLLPPRSFVVPPAVVSAPPTIESEVDAADEVQAEEPTDESPFSSLLSIAQPPAPRQDFVRIEENRDESLEIEPVVIFPGQAARLSAVDAPTASASASEEPASFRRFDSPESAEAGQQIAASAAAPQDAAETERALRAALANLQRMSGAA
jgi:hypothetical protein